MFRTAKMQKIRLVGLRSRRQEIVRKLHHLGVIDIRKSKLEIADDVPEESLPEISEQIVRYSSAMTILQGYAKKAVEKRAREISTQPKLHALLAQARGFKAVDDTLALDEEIKVIDDDSAKLESEIKTASLFFGSGIDFSKLGGETLAYEAFVIGKKALRKAAAPLRELRERYEVIENESKSGRAVLIAYEKNDAKALDGLEHVPGVRKIEIYGADFNSTPEKVVERLVRTRTGREQERRKAVAKLETHAREDRHRIESTLEMLTVEAERAGAGINFKRTESAFVVEGWIEKRRYVEIEAEMERTARGAFAMEAMDSDELAPTLVSRPAFLKPFDNLMEFFSLPRSDELDPTWIFIISFPIFYGLMVSDVGYGIVSLLFAWFIDKRTEPDTLMNSVAKVWEICAAAIIFFGFLSNQYFGFGLNQYLLPGFYGFDWLKDTPLVLGVTVLFGLAQVIVGLLFGFVNSREHGHKKLAIAKLTSVVAIVAGTVAVSGGLLGMFNGTVTAIATGVGIVALVATIALSGVEATEVVSLISHPLSYARIMGFGLASVILALLIDKTFTPSLAAGILPFLLTSAIFILLHFVNMILGIFEGLVQGARLNFVEFFSKFYTGGGVKFKPFFYRRRYTKEVQS